MTQRICEHVLSGECDGDWLECGHGVLHEFNEDCDDACICTDSQALSILFKRVRELEEQLKTR